MGSFNLLFAVLGVVLVRCEHCICFIRLFFCGVRVVASLFLLFTTVSCVLILTHPFFPFFMLGYCPLPSRRGYSPVHSFTATHDTHQHPYILAASVSLKDFSQT